MSERASAPGDAELRERIAQQFAHGTHEDFGHAACPHCYANADAVLAMLGTDADWHVELTDAAADTEMRDRAMMVEDVTRCICTDGEPPDFGCANCLATEVLLRSTTPSAEPKREGETPGYFYLQDQYARLPLPWWQVAHMLREAGHPVYVQPGINRGSVDPAGCESEDFRAACLRELTDERTALRRALEALLYRLPEHVKRDRHIVQDSIDEYSCTDLGDAWVKAERALVGTPSPSMEQSNE
jgi:hypothetical protein